jgi:hypothetical protein
MLLIRCLEVVDVTRIHLFAPRPASANLRSPMLTGSKNVVAADVARAAWHIVAQIFGSSGRL